MRSRARSAAGTRACSISAAARGFLANYLAARGHRVTGIDTTAENLDRRARARSHAARRLPARRRVRAAVRRRQLRRRVRDGSARARRAAGRSLIAEAARVLAPRWLVVLPHVQPQLAREPDRDQGRRAVRAEHAEGPPRAAAVPHARRGHRRCAARTASSSSSCAARARGFAGRCGACSLTGKVGDDFAFTFTRSTRLGFTGICAQAPCAHRCAAISRRSFASISCARARCSGAVIHSCKRIQR